MVLCVPSYSKTFSRHRTYLHTYAVVCLCLLPGGAYDVIFDPVVSANWVEYVVSGMLFAGATRITAYLTIIACCPND